MNLLLFLYGEVWKKRMTSLEFSVTQQYRQNTQKTTAGKNKLRKQKTEEGFKSACKTCGIRGNTKEVTFI
jgi:hypothetical protein